MFKFLNPFQGFASRKQAEGLRYQLYDLKDFLMAISRDTVERLTAQSTKIEKISSETRSLVDKVKELSDALANANTQQDPEVTAALDKVDAQLAVVDDLVPDAAPGSTPTESATGEVTEEATLDPSLDPRGGETDAQADSQVGDGGTDQGQDDASRKS